LTSGCTGISRIESAAVPGLRSRMFPVVIHALNDGRDVAPGRHWLLFETYASGVCPKARSIATSYVGRYFGMDRDNRLGPAWPEPMRRLFCGQGVAAEPRPLRCTDAYGLDREREFITARRVAWLWGCARRGRGVLSDFRADRAAKSCRRLQLLFCMRSTRAATQVVLRSWEWRIFPRCAYGVHEPRCMPKPET